MNITVYEKPTCTTCRKLNKLFEEKGIDWRKVNYFIEPFDELKLTALLKKAGMKPYEALRRNERHRRVCRGSGYESHVHYFEDAPLAVRQKSG